MRIIKKLPLLAVLIMILILCTASAGVAAEKEGQGPPGATNPQLKALFNDVAANDNNALFINYLADREIIAGYPDGSYHPQEGLTRAQAAVVLVKTTGLETPAVSQSAFVDVKSDHWAASCIAAAAQAGYLKGYPDGNFYPDEKLTRAQGVALVMRLSKQEKRDELPDLKDMPQNHWAAADMAIALNAGMIELSQDKTQVNPEAVMTRGSLARALGTLLVKDPGLYTKTLAGTITGIKGEVKLTRNGATTTLQNNTPVYKGDSISSGANSTASLEYPDGSSVLINENTELQIKESLGRAYIKGDGTGGIAVDNVDLDLKKGTLLGALATRHENTPEKPQAQSRETLLASLDGLGYIAETAKTPPWYQQAEVKKVKMKIDMPYGVASVRGTFVLVTIKQDEQGNITGCDIDCITGDATVTGTKDQVGTDLKANTGTTLNNQGNTTGLGAISEEGKQKLAEAAVQKWAVNTALNMDKNKEAKVEILIEVPDQASVEQQIQNTIDLVIKALEASGVKITEEAQQIIENSVNSEQTRKELEEAAKPNNSPGTGGGGGSPGETSVNYLHYAAADTTYGPEKEADIQTIGKNVIVSAPGITLRNMVITRDLILGAGIGEGSITLKNVKVQGNTSILGGGSHSITMIDCELYTVSIDKNEVRIVAKGNSKIEALTLNAGATLEEANLTGAGFSSVSTGLTLPAGAKITLSGNFEAVNINAPGLAIQVAGGGIGKMNIAGTASGTALTLASGTSVAALEINAQASIGGTGQIDCAQINTTGVKMETAPLSWTVKEGITATIGDQLVSGSGGASTVSANAKLASLSLSSGKLNPVFAPATFNYSASVTNSVYAVTVSFSCQDANASMLFNNTAAAGVESSNSISLNEGANTASIKVTAQDGSTTETYTITITRGPNGVPVANNLIINGTAQVGQTLTGQYTYSDADNDPEGASICKWYRADTETGDKTVLDSVYNSTTYTVTNEDAGKYLFFEVTPVANNGVSPGSPVCSDGVLITVPNTAPTTPAITKTPSGVVTVNDMVTFTAVSTDAEGDQINYVWKVDNNLATETAPEAGKYAAGSHTVTVKARDEHGLESQPATMVFNVYDNATGDGGLTLTSAHSRLYANVIEGATITGYSFNVPKVNGHMSPNDYGEVRGLTVDGNWEVLDHKATTNGVFFSRNETSGKCSYMTYTYYVGEMWVENETTAAKDMSPGKYRCLEFYYYTDHDCMYDKSNITFSVNYVLGSAPSSALPEAVPGASNVTISGTPAAGQTLIASYSYSDSNNDLEGIATYGATTSFDVGKSYYQWYRADDSNGTVNKTPIGTAAKSYTVTNNDTGKYIFFEVTPSSLTGTTRTGTPVASNKMQVN